jgi:acetoin utilization protein AcuC
LCDGKLIALGGGGYGLWTVVPRAWTSVWAAISGQPLPDRVPESWRERWREESPESLPTRMHNPLDAIPPVPRQEAASQQNRETASAVAERGLP